MDSAAAKNLLVLACYYYVRLVHTKHAGLASLPRLVQELVPTGFDFHRPESRPPKIVGRIVTNTGKVIAADTESTGLLFELDNSPTALHIDQIRLATSRVSHRVNRYWLQWGLAQAFILMAESRYNIPKTAEQLSNEYLDLIIPDL